ncbi:MAG: hypothetical protein P5700_13305 [Arthrospira platensis PCC 7345]|uniref:hypothetical protein n=2 Tax=Oscillatoriophycideae TaxID=1301283 RepID=UPI0028E12AC8|nr:hypothetical protein [Arthrospira sp. PLM2.Bin9]MDT9183823.1 hypothetical protein [Limnospira sp. PMC 289.06]MDT9296011.1 hypothetical protein [Arthrospira platensis PCC 7345]
MMKVRRINNCFMMLMLLGAIASIPVEAIASPHHHHHGGGEYGKFSKIEQPLGLKLGITLAGIGLIGLELWWFMFSEPPRKKSGD